jgi:hypothetical protein
MNRPQYIFMCIIGAIAVMAYLQSREVAKALSSANEYRAPRSVEVRGDGKGEKQQENPKTKVYRI